MILECTFDCDSRWRQVWLTEIWAAASRCPDVLALHDLAACPFLRIISCEELAPSCASGCGLPASGISEASVAQLAGHAARRSASTRLAPPLALVAVSMALRTNSVPAHVTIACATGFFSACLRALKLHSVRNVASRFCQSACVPLGVRLAVMHNVY